MLRGISGNLHFYLALSAVLFVFGLLAILSRRNSVGVFMGVELMLNGAALNFVAFQSLRKPVAGADNWLHGHVFALFIIILAAIETAVALAIVLRVFATNQSIDPDRATELKG